MKLVETGMMCKSVGCDMHSWVRDRSSDELLGGLATGNEVGGWDVQGESELEGAVNLRRRAQS